MKTFENKNNDTQDSYATLIDVCLIKSGTQSSEMVMQRAKCFLYTKDAGETIEIEDADFDVIKQAVLSMPWDFSQGSKDNMIMVSEFIEYVKSI